MNALPFHSMIAALLSLSAFVVAYRSFQKKSIRYRAWAWIAACFLALPSVSFSLYYLHLTREAAWYYEYRSWYGVEYLLIACGVAGGITASLLPRVCLVLPLLATVVFSLVPMCKTFLAPIPEKAFSDQWQQGVCLQSTPSTCGAASITTILAEFGVKTKERDVARAAHSYAGGTEAWYLARVVRSHGLRAHFDFRNAFPGDQALPALVGVRLGAIGHFIPMLARDSDRYLIGDPLHGKEWLTREALEQRYNFTGFCLEVSR